VGNEGGVKGLYLPIVQERSRNVDENGQVGVVCGWECWAR
jgi:hypothetical protein